MKNSEGSINVDFFKSSQVDHLFCPVMLPALSGFWLETPIPANSYTLCVSLMPVDQRHRSHGSRTIFHAWLTNPEDLFSLKHFNNKNSIQFPRKLIPIKAALCRVWVLHNKRSRARRDFKLRTATFGNLQKSSEYLRQYSEVIVTFWQCSEVLVNFSEIRVIWIRKSHAFDLGKVGRHWPPALLSGTLNDHWRWIVLMS